MLTSARARQAAVALAVMLLPAALLAYRLAVPVRYLPPQGGSTVFVLIPVLYVLPILAGLAALLLDIPAVRLVFKTRWAWVGFACLVADVAVYAIAGYAERSFKLTAALTLPVLAMLGAAFTGIYLYKWRPRTVDGLVTTTMVVSAGSAVAQMTQRAGLSTPMGRWMVAWDEATADRFHTYVIPARAQGFELNPNILAPMAIVGVLWALLEMPRGWLRTVCLVSASLIAILSMSRTAFMVLIVILAIAAAREAGSDRLKVAAPRLLKVGLIVSLAVSALLFLRFGPFEITDSGIVRRSPGIQIESPSEDSGVGPRLMIWRASWEAIQDNPWGHLRGYREISKLRPHAHNEALFRLVFAGPAWLLVHLVFLAWLAFWLAAGRHRWTSYAIAASLVVNGLTESLFMMRPYNVLLYLIIGALVWERVAERQTRSSHSS